MADIHWTNYVATISGLIGAIAGILAYRKANTVKNLDMRVELKREANYVVHALSDLNELMEKANRSRINVLAATGRLGAGDKKVWDNTLADNYEKINLWSPLVKDSSNYDDSLSTSELEKELILLNKAKVGIDALREEYSKSLKEDKDTSQRLMDAAIKQHS